MIRLIAAIDNKRGLAKNGKLTWDIPADRQFFREQTNTKGAVVLMGRKTYDAIGHSLKGRRNIVLTHKNKRIPGTEIATDLSILKRVKDVWIIGGADVFAQTIDVADELYLTHIETDFDCDQFFPDYANDFEQTWRSPTQSQNGFSFWYEVLKRRSR